ncbi:MAG: hypothetical protein AAB368_12170, partial [bacterium]
MRKATGYRVYRGAAAGGESLLGFSSGESNTSYSDSPPLGGVTYFYVVRALDSGGNLSASSVEVSGATAIPPDPPLSLTATSGTAWAGLEWAPVSATYATFGVGGYRVYRSTDPAAGWTLPVGTAAGAGASTYVDGTVTGGLTYYYSVRTFDNQAPPNESAWLTAPFDARYSATVFATPRVPAGVPGGLTILYGPTEHDGKLRLSWIMSATGSLDVIGYQVYRATFAGGVTSSVFVSSWEAVSYVDVALANTQQYYYMVAAVESKFFESARAAVEGAPYADQVPPTGLSGLPGNGAASLSWAVAPATPAGAFPITSYQVYRATVSGLDDLEPAARVGGFVPAPPVTDSGLPNGWP